MNRRLLGILTISIMVFAQGCKTGYNRTKRPVASGQKPPTCAQAASNTNLSQEGEEVFKLLADLTCFKASLDGNLIGQNLGSGDQIADEDNIASYAKLVELLTTQAGATPVVINVDYAKDQRYDALELSKSNDILAKHWQKGGLIAVSWTPTNPWTSTDDDPTTAYSSNVNLTDLTDETSAIYPTWQQYLDDVATALDELQSRNIAVLWRPFPEMNDGGYWWGVQANVDSTTPTSAKRYTDLWESIYTYLTDTKGLNNLLWVYSPLDLDSTRISADAKSAVWAYPGEETVDIVAPVVRTDSLQIREYKALLDLERPFAVAEWGPRPDSDASVNKKFDATAYSDRLQQSYPFVSFWLAPKSESNANLALIDQLQINDLFKRTHIITLEDAKADGMLSSRSSSSTSSSSSSSSSSSAASL